MTTTVLHLINTGGPGGAETMCVNLVRTLDRSRYRPIVLVPGREWMHDALEEAGIEVVLQPWPWTSRREWPALLRAVDRLIRRERVELVHAHFFGPSFVASLFHLLRGVATVGTIHGHSDLGLDERFMGLKRRLLGRGMSRVVFVSDALRDHFVGAGVVSADAATVIPNGVDVEAFGRLPRGTLRAELRLPADSLIVGAIGNCRPAKAYDVLVRAAALLRDAADPVDVHVVVVGQCDNALGAELLRMRDQLGLKERVIFTGFRADVRPALADFDVFVLPSRAEGFSIATIEAMAAGRAIVATRSGGPERILEDEVTGLLVPTESPEALASAIRRLASDRTTRERLGAAAVEAARARFTLEASVRQYEALYASCLEPAGVAAGARASAQPEGAAS